MAFKIFASLSHNILAIIVLYFVLRITQFMCAYICSMCRSIATNLLCYWDTCRLQCIESNRIIWNTFFKSNKISATMTMPATTLLCRFYCKRKATIWYLESRNHLKKKHLVVQYSSFNCEFFSFLYHFACQIKMVQSVLCTYNSLI